jgi:ferredoxin-like protein FixX
MSSFPTTGTSGCIRYHDLDDSDIGHLGKRRKLKLSPLDCVWCRECELLCAYSNANNKHSRSVVQVQINFS